MLPYPRFGLTELLRFVPILARFIRKVLFMKTLMVSALLALASMATASFAEGKCWSGCGGAVFANAGAGGFAGTAMGGDWTDTFSNQDANAITLTDTNPEFAIGSASLSQQTGGVAYGHNSAGGELFMSGETFAYAQVGRRGVGADTYTLGFGNVGADASGEYTEVQTSLYGQSSQNSLAVDTPDGGVAESEAEQLTFGSAYGSAYGSVQAATQVSVSVVSVAEAN